MLSGVLSHCRVAGFSSWMSSNVPLLTQSWAAACLANSVTLDWCSTQSGRGFSSGCMISMLMRTSTTVHTTPKVKGTGRRKIDLCKMMSYTVCQACSPCEQYPRAPEGFEENIWCGFASWGLAVFVFCLLASFANYNRLFGWKQLFKLRYKGFFKAAIILLKIVRQETCSNIMPSITKAIVSVIAHFSNTFQFFLREVSLSPLLFYYSFLPPEIIPLLDEI